MKKKFFVYFLVSKGLSNDGVGVARGTVLQETPHGAGFENRRFREKTNWVGNQP